MADNSFLTVLNVADPFYITNLANNQSLEIKFSPLLGILPGFQIFNSLQPNSGLFFEGDNGNVNLYSGNGGSLGFSSDTWFAFSTNNGTSSVMLLYIDNQHTSALGAFTFQNTASGGATQMFIIDELGGFDFRLFGTGVMKINSLKVIDGSGSYFTPNGQMLFDANHSFYDRGGTLIFNLVDFGGGMTMNQKITVKAAGLLSSDASPGINTTVTTALLVGKTLTFKDGICTGFA